MYRSRGTRVGRPSASSLRAPSMPRRLSTQPLHARPSPAAPRLPSLLKVPSRSISLDRGEPMKAGRPRVYVDSVGRILEHYVPPEKLTGFFSPKKLWSYLRSWTTWFWTRRRLIMKFGRIEWYTFKKQLAPRYIKFHEALAAGDQHVLRSLMTEAGFNALKSSVSLDRNRKYKYVWKIADIGKPKIVSYGLIGGQIPGAGWTILVRMNSRQSLAIYDVNGALVSGDEAFKPVSEYMIFEACVKKGAPWKITTKVARNGKPVYELTSGDDNPATHQST